MIRDKRDLAFVGLDELFLPKRKRVRSSTKPSYDNSKEEDKPEETPPVVGSGCDCGRKLLQVLTGCESADSICSGCDGINYECCGGYDPVSGVPTERITHLFSSQKLQEERESRGLVLMPSWQLDRFFINTRVERIPERPY